MASILYSLHASQPFLHRCMTSQLVNKGYVSYVSGKLRTYPQMETFVSGVSRIDAYFKFIAESDVIICIQCTYTYYLGT